MSRKSVILHLENALFTTRNTKFTQRSQVLCSLVNLFVLLVVKKKVIETEKEKSLGYQYEVRHFSDLAG